MKVFVRNLPGIQKHAQRSAVTKRFLIATIPMIRNLIEYTKGDNSPDFLLLTSLLHAKSNTHEVSLKELITIFNTILGTNIPEDPEKVISLIFHQADLCATESEIY